MLTQTVLETQHQSIVALTRTSLDGNQQILVLANVGDQPVTIELDQFPEIEVNRDLLGGKPATDGKYVLAPNDIAWLT